MSSDDELVPSASTRERRAFFESLAGQAGETPKYWAVTRKKDISEAPLQVKLNKFKTLEVISPHFIGIYALNPYVQRP
jgi:hypothetical protein